MVDAGHVDSTFCSMRKSKISLDYKTLNAFAFEFRRTTLARRFVVLRVLTTRRISSGCSLSPATKPQWLVNHRDHQNIPVPIPALTVQRRIVDILSAYDDLIENNQRRMALLEEAARQLYREWFVRLRFPGHEHTRITHGVPEGWERSRHWRHHAKIGSGATPRGGSDSLSGQGITLFHGLNVYDERFEDEALVVVKRPRYLFVERVHTAATSVVVFWMVPNGISGRSTQAFHVPGSI